MRFGLRLAGVRSPSASVLGALLLFSPVRGFAAAAAPPAGCAGLPDKGVDIKGLALFAYPIENSDVLSLTDRVVHLNSRARKELIGATIGAHDPALRSQIDAAVRSTCTGEMLRYAALRATAELSRAWDDVDAGRLEAFANGPLMLALGAEASLRALTPDTFAAALHAFPPESPDPQTTQAPVTCTAADNGWVIRDAPEPCIRTRQSKSAKSARLSCSLRSTRTVFRDRKSARRAGRSGSGQGGGEMVFSTLVSAASTRYGPRKKGCDPDPASIVFRADFQADGVFVKQEAP